MGYDEIFLHWSTIDWTNTLGLTKRTDNWIEMARDRRFWLCWSQLQLRWRDWTWKNNQTTIDLNNIYTPSVLCMWSKSDFSFPIWMERTPQPLIYNLSYIFAFIQQWRALIHLYCFIHLRWFVVTFNLNRSMKYLTIVSRARVRRDQEWR